MPGKLLSPLTAPAATEDGPDSRSQAERRGDTLADILRLAANCTDTPAKPGNPSASWSASASTWVAGIGQGLLDAEIRRISCNAKVIPVALGSQEQTPRHRPRHPGGAPQHPTSSHPPRPPVYLSELPHESKVGRRPSCRQVVSRQTDHSGQSHPSLPPPPNNAPFRLDDPRDPRSTPSIYRRPMWTKPEHPAATRCTPYAPNAVRRAGRPAWRGRGPCPRCT